MKLRQILSVLGNGEVNRRIGAEVGGTMGLFKLGPELFRVKKFVGELNFHEDGPECMNQVLDYAYKYPYLDKLLKLTKTSEIIHNAERRAVESGWVYASSRALEDYGIKLDVRGGENIPEEGSIFVANHLYGLADSIALIAGLGGKLEGKGRELKVVGSHLLKIVKGLEKILFFVDIPASVESAQKNMRTTDIKPNIEAVKKIIKYLKGGGDLAIYPAATPSGENLQEYGWRNGLGGFVKYSNVVPMWFNGPEHDFLYEHLAETAPELRTLAGMRDTFEMRGKTITLNIGKPMYKDELSGLGGNGHITEYIRERCEELSL